MWLGLKRQKCRLKYVMLTFSRPVPNLGFDDASFAKQLLDCFGQDQNETYQNQNGQVSVNNNARINEAIYGPGSFNVSSKENVPAGPIIASWHIAMKIKIMGKSIENLFKYFIKVTSLMEVQGLSGKLTSTSAPKSCNGQEIDCGPPAVIRDWEGRPGSEEVVWECAAKESQISTRLSKDGQTTKKKLASKHYRCQSVDYIP